MTIQNTLSSDVMLQLGAYRFGVSTAAYQELSRVTEQRWAAQERFGQLAALQYVGPGSDTITLQGLIYTEWRGGTGQPDTLRELAASGSPQTLVDGLGVVHGRWIIERVDERQQVFAGAGVPKKQDFTIAIRKFDDGAPDSGIRADGLPSALTPVGSTVAPAFVSQAEAGAAIGGLASAGQASVSTVVSALQSNLVKIAAVSSALGGRSGSALGAMTRSIEVGAKLSASFTTAATLVRNPTAATNTAAAGGIMQAAGDGTTVSSSSGAILSRMLATLPPTTEPATTGAVRSALLNANTLTRLCRDTAAASSGLKARIGS